MSKIAQIFQKRSSPDKSTSNDTSTDPVSALKFKYFQDRLEALNQQYGDIQKISMASEQFSCTEAQTQYKILYDEIKKDRILKTKETKQFEIDECKAVSAFRAGKFQEHNKHLLNAYKNYGPGRDESIIGLERWVERYKNLDQDLQTKVPSISEEYDSLLKEVKEDVQLLINLGKHDQARAEMKYLNENSHNFHIFDLYFSIIKNPKEALKYFEDKSKNNLTQRQDIHDILKKWQNHLSNQVNDKEVAAKAATYASKYNSNPTVATAPVKKSVKKAEKDVEKLQEQLDKAELNLKTVITVDKHEKQKKELKAKHAAEKAETASKHKVEKAETASKHKVEKAETASKHKAELEKTNAEFNAKLEELKPKDSPTKDTKVDEVGDSTTTSSLAPAYTSIPFVGVAEKTPTAPVVMAAAEEVLKELMHLANLIAGLQYYDPEYNKIKEQAKELLNEVIKENLDVYKIIEDSKTLVLLADVLLSSNEMEQARIVCKKALDNDLNIWRVTNDQVVLLNLAGVLLLSFSNEPEAKAVYNKAINMRIFSADEHGDCKIDANRTSTVSKTVAQDGYSAEERDCLAEVCLSSSKAFQIAQALNCYPHTDVAKREAISGQFKQLAKQISEKNNSGYKGYLLYSKAYSVLKDDQVLFQDMREAYDSTRFATIMPTVHSYPPTEESTCYLLGMCANNNY